MELYPAIDLLEGCSVRLVRGQFSQRTTYGDPVEAAAAMVRDGARHLHVVDLDAAKSGQLTNRSLVEAIVSAVPVPVQVGGGVRSPAVAEELLAAGVGRVVIGTAAAESPGMVRDLAQAHPGQVVVGLDHRGGELAVRGWTATAGARVTEVLGLLGDTGVAGVVVTDIARDGTLQGPDTAGLAEVLAATPVEVIASGGVGSDADLARLAVLAAGGRRLAGVIVGRAIHDGTLSVREALAACET